MARFNNALSYGDLVAAADYRTTGQYRFVRLSAANTVATTTLATQPIIGVLNNTPNAGEAAEVVFAGECKVIAGAAITAGSEVMSDTQGRAITAATASNRTSGFMAVEAAAAAGDIITIVPVLGRII